MHSPQIIMITGHQRSGTTALFKALSQDPSLLGINESSDNEIFRSWNLKPEPDIRDFLQSLDQRLLTKPVNETNTRHLSEIIKEYAAYDLHIIFLYRDPVNVYFSQVMKRIASGKPVLGFFDFGVIWNQRNRMVLEVLDQHHEQISLIKYEDLTHNSRVFDGLCEQLQIEAESTFRDDSKNGVKYLYPKVREQLTAQTQSVMDQLNSGRFFI